VPPAKSSALSWLAIQPPAESLPVNPSNANTQCATGKYTTVTQIVTNNAQPQNFARSAMAPEMSAGVIAANISWNMQNASSGSASGPGQGTGGGPCAARPTSLPNASDSPAKSKFPTRPPNASLPKDSEKPKSTHSTPTMASAMKFIINMFKTLFARTMPP